MKGLYKYPRASFLLGWSRRTSVRSRRDAEFELVDTGVFDEDATSTSSPSTPRQRRTIC